ncbi:hypothetical protein BH20CHL4_BH20CHL4_09420 [soil metagenome]
MKTRCCRACVAWVTALLLVAALFLDPAFVAARTRPEPNVSLSAYLCPASVTAATASSIDCELIPDGFDVEIISIDGSQPNVTLADARRDGDIYRWEVEPSDAEIDNWGIRQLALPPGARAYLIQGETATPKATALYDYRFTTSESDPQTDLTMFILLSAADGVIIPPSEETSITNDQAATNDSGGEAPSASGQSTTNAPGSSGDDASTLAATTESDAVANSHARTTGAYQDLRTIEREPTPMRLAADPRAMIVEVLGQGAVVGVLSGPEQIDNGSWFEVESSSKSIGWVNASAFEPPPASAGSGSTTTESLAAEAASAQAPDPATDVAPIIAELALGDRAIVFDPPLQLRVAGDIGAEVIDSLEEGQLLLIDGESTSADGYDWYAVSLLPDGTVSGFVAGGFMMPAGLLAGDLVHVDSESANVRTEPTTEAVIEANIQRDSIGTVVSGPETSDGYDWYEVVFESGQSGWVADSLLVLNSSSAVEGPEAAPSIAAAGTFRPGAWVTVVDPPINLRVAPGIEAAAIEALESGDVLIVLGGPEAVDGYTWLHVEFNGLEGYAAGEFLGGGFLPGEAVRVFDGPVYLRMSPSIDGDIIIGLLQDEIVTVVSPQPVIDGDYLWIEVSTANGSTGFVATEFIEPAG